MPVDTQVPVIVLFSLTAATFVSGNLSVAFSANDNDGVTKGELIVNGVVKGTSTSAPFTDEPTMQRGTVRFPRALASTASAGIGKPRQCCGPCRYFTGSQEAWDALFRASTAVAPGRELQRNNEYAG